MNRVEVRSSNVAAIGYDPKRQLLEVEFHGKGGEPGAVWQYEPVPADVYGAMLLPGASVGQIFSREVRSNAAVSASRVDEVTA